MQRLQESLHFIDDQDMDDEDMLAGFSDEGEDDEEEQNTKSKKSSHVVFVDTEEEGKSCLTKMILIVTLQSLTVLFYTLPVKQFNPAKHLNTLPELVNRKFNRPTVDSLKKNVIANASVDSDDENEKVHCLKHNIFRLCVQTPNDYFIGNEKGPENEVQRAGLAYCERGTTVESRKRARDTACPSGKIQPKINAPTASSISSSLIPLYTTCSLKERKRELAPMRMDCLSTSGRQIARNKR